MSYVIEVYWPGMTPRLVGDLIVRVREVALERGGGVVYVGCTMAPEDEVCFVRVDAPGGDAVRAVISQLGLVGARVSETIDLPAPGSGSNA